MATKEQILHALTKFINQRPGLEYANYGDPKTYRSEMRSITKDMHHALTIMAQMAWRDSITAQDIIKASESAFSGRLTIKETPKGVAIDYCTGQYFPTEYRKAACAVLASALWNHVREHCMPEPKVKQHGSADARPMMTEHTYNGLSAGDWLRKHFRKEFGRSIQARWFD